MAMPSRKNLILITLIAFFVLLFGFLLWYFSSLIFGSTSVDQQGNQVRTPGLFPFGDGGSGGVFGNPDDVNSGQGTNAEGTVNDEGIYIPRLRQVTDSPVVTATLFPVRVPGRESQNYTNIRYVEQGTGHVYDGRTNTLNVERLSNTTIPRITEGFFTSSSTVLLRYRDNTNAVKTFSAELARIFGDESGAQRQLQGIFLDDNIRDLDYDDRTNQLFYLIQSQIDPQTTLGIVSSTLGENKRQVLESPVSEWQVKWAGTRGSVSLDSTPSFEAFGPSYTLNTVNAVSRPLLPARLALQTLANDTGDKVLISFRDNNRLNLFMWESATNQYTDLNLETMTEKCVWSADNQTAYCAVPQNGFRGFVPDSWDQGAIRLEDEVWAIDAETNSVATVVNPANYGGDTLDMIDLAITADGSYLYFRNKNDLTLWTYLLDDSGSVFFTDDGAEAIEEVDFTVESSDNDNLNTSVATSGEAFSTDIESILPLAPEEEDDF